MSKEQYNPMKNTFSESNQISLKNILEQTTLTKGRTLTRLAAFPSVNTNFFLVNEFLVLEKKTFQKVIYHVRAVWAKVILLNHVLNKILKFHLVSWCGNFVETHIALRDWVESPETLRKFHVSTHEISTPVSWVKLRYFIQ